jgi:hypothetical protein
MIAHIIYIGYRVQHHARVGKEGARDLQNVSALFIL